MSPISLNPIFLREARSRFRDKRAFLLVLGFVLGVSVLIFRGVSEQLRGERTDFWPQLVWMHTLGLLFLAPALSASSLVGERERGLLEGLQMSALSRFQIAFGKALSSYGFALLTLGCTLPPLLVLGIWLHVPPIQIAIFVAWQLVVLLLGASLGLACSAWARTTQYAFRSAYSLLVAWLAGSYTAAFASGETEIAVPFAAPSPPFLRLWGRTNPIFGTLDATFGSPFEARWPFALGFCVLVTLVALGAAAWGASRIFHNPIRAEPVSKTAEKPRRIRRELGFSRWIRPQNPILGRELRLIFRFPPPPRMVALAQTALAIPVATLYGFMIWWSFAVPATRPTIFWGVAMTLLSVSGMAAALLGANALARERETGTWQGLELSLLNAREILWGKTGAALGACVLLSFGAWPLMLVCVRALTWAIPQSAPTDAILPFQLGAFVLVWLGALARAFAVGLFFGWKTGKINVATGAALGLELFLALAGPILLGAAPDNPILLGFSGLSNPLLVAFMAGAVSPKVAVWATGIPFFVVQITIFGLVWWHLERKLLADKLGGA